MAIGLFACGKNNESIKPSIKNGDYFKAKLFLSKNNDSAFFYFNKSTATLGDSLEVAKAYYYMSVIQSDEGDYFGAQESLTLSLSFLNDKNPNHLDCFASDYNELGLISLNLKRYSSSISYYNLALKFSNDKIDQLMFLNNKALAYQKAGLYLESINLYQKILSKNIKNKKEYARVLSNLTKSKWLKNQNYPALADFIKALKIRITENDDWGQNASYAHLSDYYYKNNPDSALLYADKMYKVARKLNSPDDVLEALAKLIRLSPTQTNKQYFERYYSLADSLQTSRNAAKNQFAVIRYNAEKHKADNLVLQKENDKKKYQIIIISSAALFILLAGIFWYRKRKRDIETQSEKAITDSKLKTSKKVHDVVANGLYRVMTEIENQQDLDRNHVLDKIEDLYEKSRDISYEKPTEANKPFHETLSEILTSFATENRKVLIAGNDAELWQKVSERTKYELEHIIQELMVNMKKHSQASNVVMRFENNGEQIKIYYTDNGVGMPKDKGFNNGLRNTGNRIEEINGAIIFDTEVEKGLKIQISFPIS